jgi:C1A family cysteine protease
MKRYYGWIKQEEDNRDHQFYRMISHVDLPPVKDLRTPINTPPIVDQSQIGSCGANSSASVFLYEEISQGELNVTLKSRLFIYYFTRKLMGTVRQDSGVDNRTLMKCLNKYGACDESLWPYIISKYRTRPVKQAIAAALNHTVKEYLSINQTLTDLKASIAQGHPFVLGFNVPESFESAEMAKTGILKMPSSREKIVGGHDVYAIAYSDETETFTIGNSWGDAWGQKGYFEMPYEFICDPNWATDFWQFIVVN